MFYIIRKAAQISSNHAKLIYLKGKPRCLKFRYYLDPSFTWAFCSVTPAYYKANVVPILYILLQSIPLKLFMHEEYGSILKTIKL